MEGSAGLRVSDNNTFCDCGRGSDHVYLKKEAYVVNVGRIFVVSYQIVSSSCPVVVSLELLATLPPHESWWY